MKKPGPLLILVSIVALLVVPVTAQAQTSPPTPTPPTVTVIGTVVNRTEGGSVPASLDLVLHAWDQDLAEKLMLDGRSNPDGTFRFENVPLEPGLLYGVMATYSGISYFSKPIEADGPTLTGIEVPIYETSADTSQVRIERMHVLFFFSHAGLEVAEVYSLSNLGSRTVKDAVTLTAGTSATIEFPLPADATNVTFTPEVGDRFVRTPDGFADTAPLRPGANSGQITVDYTRPYTPGMTYTYMAQFATLGINFLYTEDSGLIVSGDGLTHSDPQQTSDGVNFAMLSRGALQRGETTSVTLSGQPTVSVTAQGESQVPGSTPLRWPTGVIGIGGIIVGLALLVVGLWWFRQSGKPIAEAEALVESSVDDLLTEIAVLDEARERNEIDHETYQARRASLFQAARSRMEKTESIAN